MKEYLFTAFMLSLLLAVVTSCRGEALGPQNAISASVRLLSVSPRVVAPPVSVPPAANAQGTMPSDQLPFKSQLPQ